ncbi:hypothetical protein L1987_81103 [Smallanthus sonchifolius]|uniref:Uncharacterized protein n=1 Tax=Smallanthus sonchifolius TaxID=185202 RepID=A0ACB8YPH8_9ASTR|nr:hypothetical protein L1987_81103 [Smallanthus sonchifolius]
MIANCTRAKFGGYGSFLPTYQRSPAGPHSKTSPKVHVNNTSPNDLHLQGGRQNSVPLSKSQTRHVPALTSSASPPRGLPGKVKQEVLMSSTRVVDTLLMVNNPLTTSLVTLVTKSHYRSESRLGLITCQVEKY